MKKKPKIIWGNAVNLSGLWDDLPLKLKYNEELKEWYDRSGNLSVRKTGVDHRDGIITFASENKELAQFWTKGAVAVMTLLRQWTEWKDIDEAWND